MPGTLHSLRHTFAAVAVEAGVPDEALGNRIEGRVNEVIYLGQSRKYVIRLETGQEISALQQAHEADRRRFGQGEQVCLSWAAHEANVLSDDTESSEEPL